MKNILNVVALKQFDIKGKSTVDKNFPSPGGRTSGLIDRECVRYFKQLSPTN